MKRLDEAMAEFDKALKIYEAKGDEEANSMVYVLIEKYLTQYQANKHEESVETLNKAIALKRKHPQADASTKLHQLLVFLSESLTKCGKSVDGERVARESLDLCRKDADILPVETGRALSALSLALLKQGKHGAAAQCLRESLKQECTQKEKNDRLLMLHSCLRKLGEIEESRLQLKQLEDWADSLEAPKDSPRAQTLYNMSSILIEEDAFETAEYLTNSAMRVLGANGREDPGLRDQLAKTYIGQLKTAEAIAIYTKLVPEVEKAAGADPNKFMAAVLAGYGMALILDGQYEKAVIQADKLRNLVHDLKIKDDDTLGMIEFMIAEAFLQMGNYDKAAKGAAIALKKLKLDGGESIYHLNVVLAQALHAQGDFKRAAELSSKALDLAKINADKYPFRANCTLAMTLRDQGKTAEAEKLFKEIGMEWAKDSKKADPGRSQYSLEYAKFLTGQKRFEEALPLAENTLETLKKHYRADHPEVMRYYAVLIEIYTGLGKTKEADKLRELVEAKQDAKR